MTKAIMDIDKHNNIMFDCINHAGNKEVCRAVSALCGVLVTETVRIDSEPTTYNDGHVRIDLFDVTPATIAVFEDVFETLKQLSGEYPEFLKVY